MVWGLMRGVQVGGIRVRQLKLVVSSLLVGRWQYTSGCDLHGRVHQAVIYMAVLS